MCFDFYKILLELIFSSWYKSNLHMEKQPAIDRLVFAKFQIAGNCHPGEKLNQGHQPRRTIIYTKSTNTFALKYRNTPALQLWGLNLQLSWKIVTWRDRHTDEHWLCLGGLPTTAQLSTCVMWQLYWEFMGRWNHGIVIVACIHRWRKVHVDWSIYMYFNITVNSLARGELEKE